MQYLSKCDRCSKITDNKHIGYLNGYKYCDKCVEFITNNTKEFEKENRRYDFIWLVCALGIVFFFGAVFGRASICG